MAAFLTTWIIDLAIPIFAGIWLGRRIAREGCYKAKTLGSAALVVFALMYLNALRDDWYYLNTFWEGSAPLHVFGPSWPSELLMGTLKQMLWELALLAGVSWAVNMLSLNKDRKAPAISSAKRSFVTPNRPNHD